MKIGVISDTHIPDRAEDIPPGILEQLSGMDMVIHAGDLVSPRVLEKLQKSCKNVHAVCGNMDPDELKKKLPQKEIIQADKYKIGLMHGYGAPANLVATLLEAFKNDKVDIIVFGHSHAPMNEKINGVLYFNPGTPTDKVFAAYNSYGIIELNDKIKARIVRL